MDDGVEVQCAHCIDRHLPAALRAQATESRTFIAIERGTYAGLADCLSEAVRIVFRRDRLRRLPLGHVSTIYVRTIDAHDVQSMRHSDARPCRHAADGSAVKPWLPP
jgi:hypothetical protein